MLPNNYQLHRCLKIFLDLFPKKFDNIGMEDIRMRIESLLKKTKDERFRYISLLADEINKKRLAVFVGAGCSISFGLPSWPDLIDGLLKKYKIKNKERDVFRLASRLERGLGPLKFREEIVRSLRINEIGKSDLHDALINLETNLFITTNYDTLLEDYFKVKGISPFIITNPKDIPSIDPTKKTIVKLHGDLNSPSSLVITAADYTKYKSEKKGFIDWLRLVAAQRSILFVGASFDDPRLKDVDDYVLNIFGSPRRQPFIFFKIPDQTAEKPDEDFAVELDDFEALCDDFRDRGFYLILVEKYEDIAEFLKEVNERVLEDKVKEDPGNLDAQVKLQSDYSGKLEKSLSILIDDKIKEMVKKVLGEGRPPGLYKIRKEMKKLIEFLNNPPHQLGPESRLQGLLCVTDAFLVISKTKSDIIKARQYYEQANEVFQELKDKSKFQERLIRLRAKLLFEEGEIDEAINSLANSKDPKTISFRLLYLTEAKRIDEAYDFIEKNEINIQWVSDALRIYINKGKISEAERLFWKALEEFEVEKEKGNIEDSDYKGDFFFDSICFVMIYSIYFKAFQLTGKKNIITINPFDFADNARRLLRKSLGFIDLFFKERPVSNPEDDYRVIQILIIEMNICRILAEFNRADVAATKLTKIEPIERQVVGYIIVRGETFPERVYTLKVISKKLEKDYTDQAWAWSAIANIEMILENTENSWNALKRTITLIDENEKNETLLMALTVGRELDKLDELFILVKSSLQFNDEKNCFWEGIINWLYGKTKEAVEKINKINELNFSVELRALMSHIKGQWEIENQNWEEARKLLEESLKVQPNPIILRSLLFVLTKLQDEMEALNVAEKIESLGIEDDQVMFIKAQVYRNLRQFEKSEKVWRKLREDYPEKSEYAFGLAHVLFFSDKEDEAKKVLKPFIQPGDKFDLNCLKLAVDIHSSLGENEKAFSILENCWREIQEQPDLIWKHVDLAFKTDNEKEAQKSLKRMEELKEEGKITDMTFFKSENLEDLVNLVKKGQESVEKVFEQYMLGFIPRITLCEIFGNTLYLDWAMRTQPLSEDFFALKGEAEFTIYSTNGFKLISKDKKIQLVPIEAPKEAKEIVIDYHALITIHRLGFIEKLCRRYQKIYYPDVFKRLWKMEQTRYTPFQLSKVKVYKLLAERLDKHEIKKAPAPIKESMVVRDLSLAQIEKIPLIDNYIKEGELSKYQDVPVIRLPQLVDWIYEKGRISEDKWNEVKKYSIGEPSVIAGNWKEILDNSFRFVVDSITLEMMEEFNINQKLLDMGAVLFVEEYTADKIHHHIRNFEFETEVAQWHKQLVREINENSTFVEVKPTYKKEEIEGKITENLNWETAYAPTKYCHENNLFLLTDDRWTEKISPRHFGTAALLRDLFENEIIIIEEYTYAFLELCKWRCRFLLPDVRVLLFIAEQYRKNLPGKDLESIASYLRKNMEDPGLSLALEPTVPPTPIALNYFLAVIDVWFQFLAEIWQKEDVFEEEKLNDITDWFYRYAMPDFPKGIQGEIRN
jgi:tetratricopeptide (TPR) repeat protein